MDIHKLEEIEGEISVEEYDEMLGKVSKNGLLLQNAPEELKNDKKIVLEAVNQNGFALCFASEVLKNDHSIVLCAVENNGSSLRFASDEMKNQEDIALASIPSYEKWIEQFTTKEGSCYNEEVGIFGFSKSIWGGYPFINPNLNSNEKLQQKILSKNHFMCFGIDEGAGKWQTCLEKEGMRTPLDCIYGANGVDYQKYCGIHRSSFPGGFSYTGLKLMGLSKHFSKPGVFLEGFLHDFDKVSRKASEDFLLTLIKRNGRVMSYFHPFEEELKNGIFDQLRRDKDFALEAVCMGRSLEFMSSNLKNDRDVVFSAVNRNGDSIQFASDELKNDQHILRTSVRKHKSALKYLEVEDPDSILPDYEPITDREELIGELERDGLMLQRADSKFLDDQEVVLLAVSEDGRALEFASERLRNDRKVVLVAVSRQGNSLEYASNELRKDFFVAYTAVMENPDALQFVDPTIVSPGLIDIAIRSVVSQNEIEKIIQFENISQEVLTESKAYQFYRFPIRVMEEKMTKDELEKVVFQMMKERPMFWNSFIPMNFLTRMNNVFKYLHNELKGDREFIKKIAKLGDGGFECILLYVNEDVRSDQEFILSLIESSSPVFEVKTEILRFISEELKKDRNFVIEALKKNTNTLKYFDEFRCDIFIRDVLKLNIDRMGSVLKFGSDRLKDDKDLVMKVVASEGGSLQFASDRLRDDKEVVMASIESTTILDSPKSISLQDLYESNNVSRLFSNLRSRLNLSYFSPLRYAGDLVKNDREVVMNAIKHHGNALEFASDEVKGDKKFVLEAIKNDGSALQFASDELRGDMDLVMEALVEDGKSLQYATDELKNNRDVVLKAISKITTDDENNFDYHMRNENCHGAMKYVGEELLSDTEFVIEAVSRNGRVIQYIPMNESNEEIFRSLALSAVEKDGLALEFVGSVLRNDREIVMKAVMNKPSALQYAGIDMKNNKGIVSAALSKDSFSKCIFWAGENVKRDKEFIFEEVSKSHCWKTLFMENLFSNPGRGSNGYFDDHVVFTEEEKRDMVIFLVSRNPSLLNSISSKGRELEKYKDDEEIIRSVILTKDEVIMETIGKNLLNNKEIVMEALPKVKYNLANQFRLVSEELRNDKEVVMFAVSLDGSCLKHVSEELRNDKEVVMLAVSAEGRSLEYASEELRNDREVVIAAVQRFGFAIQYASEDMRKDEEVVLAGIRNNYGIIKGVGFVSEDLKDNKEFIIRAFSECNEFGVETIYKESSERLRNDKEFLIVAINERVGCYEFANEELKNDEEVIFEVVKNCDSTYRGEKLLENRVKVSTVHIKEKGRSRNETMRSMVISKEMINFSRLMELFRRKFISLERTPVIKILSKSVDGEIKTDEDVVKVMESEEEPEFLVVTEKTLELEEKWKIEYEKREEERKRRGKCGWCVDNCCLWCPCVFFLLVVLLGLYCLGFIGAGGKEL